MYHKLIRYYKHKDFQYLIKEGKYKLIQQFIELGLSFFIILYLANNTSKEFFGNYKLVLVIISTLFVFSFPGIRNSILQSVARGYDYSLIRGTKKAIKFSLVGSGILILISLYYYLFKNDIKMSVIFFFCSFIFPFYFTLDNFNYFLEGKKYFKKNLVYNALLSIIRFLVILFSVFLFKENLIFLIIILLLSQILFYSYFFFRCKKMIKRKKIDKDLINYGWFMTKISWLVIISNQIDKLLVGIFINPSTLAIYSVGIFIPDKFKNIISPFTSVFMPKFAAKKTKLTKKKIIVLIILSMFLMIIVMAFLPIFIKYFFPEYTSSIKYGLVFTVIILFIPLNSLFDYYYKAIKRKGVILKKSIYPEISKILLTIILFIFFNIIGIIIAEIIKNLLISFIFLEEFLKNDA